MMCDFCERRKAEHVYRKAAGFVDEEFVWVECHVCSRCNLKLGVVIEGVHGDETLGSVQEFIDSASKR